MWQVAITDGYPWPSTFARHNFGIRVDETWATDYINGCGASRIRIRAAENLIGIAEGSFEQTLTAAEKSKLTALAVIDTNHPWPDDILRTTISNLCLAHPKLEIEALNEWDDLNAVRWENRDPVTAAHFIAVVIDAVAKTNWKRGISTPVLIGSTLDAANITRLLEALKAEKVPLTDSRVKLAAHFYPNLAADPNLDGIKNGIWYISNEYFRLTGRYPKIDITEVGLAAPLLSKWQLLKIIGTCFGQPGVNNVYLHELVNHTEGSLLDTNFGLIDYSGFTAPAYFGLAALARRGFPGVIAPSPTNKPTSIPSPIKPPRKTPTPPPIKKGGPG
jgi:hypothetical protein